jgi:U3 small nucleolar RNA-associated protein 14
VGFMIAAGQFSSESRISTSVKLKAEGSGSASGGQSGRIPNIFSCDKFQFVVSGRYPTKSTFRCPDMPGRQSHGGAPSKQPKPKARKTKKRALDAFSIASHQNPDKVKIRQHRLGAKEGGNRPGKRPRDEGEDGEEEAADSKPKKQKKGPEKGRFDELDVDEGSDSEGNEWKLGQVDSDDDSDLDSDEAFGKSDEERFNGFAFSGSSDKKVKKKTSRRKDINLNEDDVEDSDSELDEGDLGEDAVDLATMIDMVEAEEAEERAAEQKRQSRDQGGSESEMEEDIVPSTRDGFQDEEDSDSIEEAYESEEGDESEGSNDESSESDPDDDEDLENPAKIAAITNLVNNLPELEIKSRQRSNTASEYKNPDASSKGSLSRETLLGTSTLEVPQAKILKATAKKNSNPQEVPLAQRQKDRLDRAAAYDESKKTLDRWTDTVKHNRRADHLMFPLQDNETASAHANKQLLPTNLSKPFNELEATIQAILEESGLATVNGKDDEDQIREFEELQANKLSVNEVKARRAQLAMARELLFREEKKAKRIKKIKSKSYRKVHRKQREKEERLNKEALAEGGFVPSEDELEAQDRRRAEERMGAKHRGSKWAKAMKETGRAAWDEDARSGVTEMARRDEELRKRVEGRAARKEFENGSDESISDSEDDRSEDDEPAEQERLLRELKQFGGSTLLDESLPGARLASMDFMRKADAARRKANDGMVEDMRRELAGEESESEEEAGDIGRRLFGPGNSAVSTKKPKTNVSEFEEPAGSDEDVDPTDDEFRGFDDDSKADTATPQPKSKRSSKATEQLTFKHPAPSITEGGAWSKVSSKSTTISEAEAKRRRHKKNNAVDVEELDLSKASMIATQSKPRKSVKKISTLEMNADSDESGDESTVNLPFAIKDQELIKRAFAGADVVGEFEDEKKQTIEDEDEKFIDNRLPGWGSWVGEGITKKDKARNKERFLTKQEGIKEKDRKDAKLARVIINEKRVKKVCFPLFVFQMRN